MAVSFEHSNRVRIAITNSDILVAIPVKVCDNYFRLGIRARRKSNGSRKLTAPGTEQNENSSL